MEWLVQAAMALSLTAGSPRGAYRAADAGDSRGGPPAGARSLVAVDADDMADACETITPAAAAASRPRPPVGEAVDEDALAPQRARAKSKAIVLDDDDDDDLNLAATAAAAPAPARLVAPPHTAQHDAAASAAATSGAAAPASEAHAGARTFVKAGETADTGGGKGGKNVARRKTALALPPEQLAAVFDQLAGGKVTIGADEFMTMVSRLDLDVGEDMAEAAWELVAQSQHAGPCNRLNAEQFVAFVQTLTAG